MSRIIRESRLTQVVESLNRVVVSERLGLSVNASHFCLVID